MIDAAKARPLPEEPSNSEHSLEIILNEGQWQLLEQEWREIYAVCPTASPPLGWEWTRTWWSLFGGLYAVRNGEDEGLRLHVIRKNGRMVGVLPLYLRRSQNSPLGSRRLCFLSTGEAEFEEVCAENLDLLYLPEDRDACLNLLRDALLKPTANEWDELHLSPISVNSALSQWRMDVFEGGLGAKDSELGPSFLVNLEEGFEGYLSLLSSNSRGLARKRTRGAIRDGAVFQVAETQTEADEMFEQLIVLHQARWVEEGKLGCFSAPRFTEFHRLLISRLLDRKEAIIARMAVENETVSVMLGYIAGKKFDSYVAGAKFDDERIKSPGITLHLLLKERLATQGIAAYDHMSGTMRYKQQYSTSEAGNFSLELTRPTLRTNVGLVSNVAKRVALKGRDLFRQRFSAQNVGDKTFSEAK